MGAAPAFPSSVLRLWEQGLQHKLDGDSSEWQAQKLVAGSHRGVAQACKALLSLTTSATDGSINVPGVEGYADGGLRKAAVLLPPLTLALHSLLCLRLALQHAVETVMQASKGGVGKPPADIVATCQSLAALSSAELVAKLWDRIVAIFCSCNGKDGSCNDTGPAWLSVLSRLHELMCGCLAVRALPSVYTPESLGGAEGSSVLQAHHTAVHVAARLKGAGRCLGLCLL